MRTMTTTTMATTTMMINEVEMGDKGNKSSMKEVVFMTAMSREVLTVVGLTLEELTLERLILEVDPPEA